MAMQRKIAIANAALAKIKEPQLAARAAEALYTIRYAVPPEYEQPDATKRYNAVISTSPENSAVHEYGSTEVIGESVALECQSTARSSERGISLPSGAASRPCR